MRENNVSIPSRNQAASVITHALYDRRALDCTSTLPLVNSLNSLAYLTTSSARIRDILTRDGGLERLVTILKRSKCRTPLESLKWYYALQCVVNIGVRGADSKSQESSGSEAIRTRVVEADIVPVVATLLDNYLQGTEKLKESGEINETPHLRGTRSQAVPPRIDTSTLIVPPPPPTLARNTEVPILLSSPADVPSPLQQRERRRERHHHHHRSDPIIHWSAANRSRAARRMEVEAPPTRPEAPSTSSPQVVIPNRDLVPPPMSASYGQDGITSHPQSPATPIGPVGPLQTPTIQRLAEPNTNDSLQPDPSVSGDSDEEVTQAVNVEARDTVMELEVTGAAVDDNVVEASENIPGADGADDEYNSTFSIRHRSVDGQLTEPTQAQLNAGARTDVAGPSLASPQLFTGVVPGHQLISPNAAAAPTPSETVSWMPRAEHVVLSLQLLAYVSKYCQLRSYFQNCHLVPALRPECLRKARENDPVSDAELDAAIDNEYCQPDDYNIFPLVEKFTVKSYSADMKYWAGVVMRNLCRKDKTRGDIRQCAYYKCGQWEQFARQFAKCRRCRQTKYCSKECQKSAWVYHRHWCEPVKDPHAVAGGSSTCFEQHSTVAHAHAHGHGHAHAQATTDHTTAMEIDAPEPGPAS